MAKVPIKKPSTEQSPGVDYNQNYLKGIGENHKNEYIKQQEQ